MAQQVKSLSSTHEEAGLIPGLSVGGGSHIAVSCGVGCRCGSGVAVAVVHAGSCSSSLTPSLGISKCRRSSPLKKKKKKKKFGISAGILQNRVHFINLRFMVAC